MKIYYVYYRGKWIDTLGAHYNLDNEDAAFEKYRSLHPELDYNELSIKLVPGCNHEFKGWREFADGRGGEQVCTKCGMGAMTYTLSQDV